MVSAWEEVETGVIVKCFKHVGMHPEEKDNTDEDDDPFAGEDLLDLDEMVRKGSGDVKKLTLWRMLPLWIMIFPPTWPCWILLIQTGEKTYSKRSLRSIPSR